MIRIRTTCKLLAFLALLTSASASVQSAGDITSIVGFLLEDIDSEIVLAEGNKDVSEESQQVISEVQPSVEGNPVLSIASSFIDQTEEFEFLTIQPGADNRFPLGLSGRAVQTSGDSGGVSMIEVEPVPLAEAMESVELDINRTSLTAENFVGVIAPDAVVALNPAAGALSSRSAKASDSYSFRNGAITIGNENNLSRSVDGVVTPSQDISLNLKVRLDDMGDGIEASTAQPIDVDGEVAFEITGGLSNIRITNQTSLSKTKTSLDKLNLKLEGDLEVDFRFNGKGNLQLGYFSQAWKEVEDKTFQALGISGKITGLSNEDKIGKYPLAGLIWTVPCATTCPITAGQTQTPLRAAKAAGIIVWLYLDIAGEFTVENSFSIAKLNKSNIKLGVMKSSTGALDAVNSLENANSGQTMLEVLNVSSGLNASFKAGITAHIDVFIAGIRLANASLSVRSELGVDIDGFHSFKTESLSQPWSFSGDFCAEGRIGAGAVFNASAGLGLELETSWRDISGSFDYAFETPSEAARAMDGLSGTWYNLASADFCFSDLDNNGLVINVDTTTKELYLTGATTGSTALGGSNPNKVYWEQNGYQQPNIDSINLPTASGADLNLQISANSQLLAAGVSGQSGFLNLVGNSNKVDYSLLEVSAANLLENSDDVAIPLAVGSGFKPITVNVFSSAYQSPLLGNWVGTYMWNCSPTASGTTNIEFSVTEVSPEGSFDGVVKYLSSETQFDQAYVQSCTTDCNFNAGEQLVITVPTGSSHVLNRFDGVVQSQDGTYSINGTTLNGDSGGPNGGGCSAPSGPSGSFSVIRQD